MQRWRNRFSSAVLAVALASSAGAQNQPAAQNRAATQTQARPATMGGHPNFNGMWQTINTAYWNLEAHPAEALGDFWGLGAIAAIPAGKSVITGDGKIPYLPAALEQRNKNRALWPGADPEAKCFILGVPRVTYHNMPFQIFQGTGDVLMVYPFAATNRVIFMNDKSEPAADTWMGKSMGAWEGNVLVITTNSRNGKTWMDREGNYDSADAQVTERFTLVDADHIRYQATLDDPKTYSRPWTMEMPLYRLIDQNVEVLEHKCVPFADKLLYSDLMHLEPQQKNAPDPKKARE